MPRPTTARVGRANRGSSARTSADGGTSRVHAIAVVVASTAVAARTWATGLTPAPSARAVVPAPARPPRLHMPWNDDMIGRGNRASTATACAFIETSRAPLLAPRTKSAIARSGRLGARTGSGNAAKKTSALRRTTVLLPSRAVAHPDKGIPASAPPAIARSVKPSTLVPSPSDA